MNRILIFPPFADPTQPFLSLPALKGHLRQCGMDVKVLDLNIEAVHRLLQKDSVEALARKIGGRFAEFNRARSLAGEEIAEYRALYEARPKVEWMLAAEPHPLEVLKRQELFFDPSLYATTRRLVDGLFDAVGAAHFPYQYGFNQCSHAGRPWGLDLLEEYWEERRSPCDAFYREVFEGGWMGTSAGEDHSPIDFDELEFAGISIAFPSQVAEAFYLCRYLRERAPGALIVLGGPCVHQIAVHMDERLLAGLLRFVDGICVFEGEETLVQLFRRLKEWPRTPKPADRVEVLRSLPNLLFLDPEADVIEQGRRYAHKLENAADPDWTDHDLDRYLAPSRVLLYAPARGCYWGKCSFCYYGLCETATASYREIPPQRAAAQLAKLARRHGVRNFYLSCDVLSPSYAARLAQEILDRELKVRWSCDLRAENAYDRERCELLYRSGLRAAALGMESGSDRILALMHKGCDRAAMTRVNRAFHDAGVATAWMTFTGHPGETADEALETVRWIAAEQDAVDLFIVDRFALLAGSHIAADPAAYGLFGLQCAEGDDLRLCAMSAGGPGAAAFRESVRLEAEIDRLSAGYALRPYPWAGAISTHHSFLHFLHRGQRAFRTHFQRGGGSRDPALGEPPPSHVAGLRARPRWPEHLKGSGAARK